jgi:hypothetical protein
VEERGDVCTESMEEKIKDMEILFASGLSCDSTLLQEIRLNGGANDTSCSAGEVCRRLLRKSRCERSEEDLDILPEP